MKTYRALDPQNVIETIAALRKRNHCRPAEAHFFPGAGNCGTGLDRSATQSAKLNALRLVCQKIWQKIMILQAFTLETTLQRDVVQCVPHIGTNGDMSLVSVQGVQVDLYT